MSIWDTPTTDSKLDQIQRADEVTFIGQDHIKKQIVPFFEGDLPHILLTGQPGLGKTQFAKWVAWKTGKPFYERLAPVKADWLPPWGVVLLDEVHRQSNVESLFPLMDKGLLTIVAATTKPDKLDSAFRSRFLITLTLKPYTVDEMVRIVNHMADEEVPSADVLANACLGNPRTAERIVRTAQGLRTWDARTILETVRITADGLTDDHFDYLVTLEKAKRPLGEGQMKNMVWATDEGFKAVERLLIEMELVELRPQGRRLTPKGESYIDMLETEGVL